MNVIETMNQWGWPVTIVGIVIVFALLVLFVLIFQLFGAVSSGIGKKAKTVEQPKPAAVVDSAPSVDNRAVIAVIAAAVDAMYDGTGKRAVIKSVKPAKSGNSRSAWAAAGVRDNVRAF